MNPVTPPPLPSRQGSLLRAVCGPLLLTTLGVLLAADHMGQISFARSWPILVILFGVCKLGEHVGVR